MPDVFFLPEYGRLYEQVDGGTCEVFEFHNEHGTIRHMFIKRPVPWQLNGKQYYDIRTPYGYGGPLITCLRAGCTQDQLMRDFQKAFSGYCEENDIICEFVRFHTLFDNALYCRDMYEVTYNRHTIAIDLTDPDFFDTQFDAKCRNMVRKAEKNGITIALDRQLASMDTFPDIYYATMTKDNADKYYFFDRRYFLHIREALPGRAMLVNALWEGKTVASSLFLYTPGGFAHYHLSATELGFYRLAANNLIIRAACDALRAEGCTWLHLGGGLSSDPADSLLAFKKTFGRKERNIKDFYVGKKIWSAAAYEKAVALFLRAGGEQTAFFPAYRG